MIQVLRGMKDILPPEPDLGMIVRPVMPGRIGGCVSGDFHDKKREGFANIGLTADAIWHFSRAMKSRTFVQLTFSDSPRDARQTARFGPCVNRLRQTEPRPPRGWGVLRRDSVLECGVAPFPLPTSFRTAHPSRDRRSKACHPERSPRSEGPRNTPQTVQIFQGSLEADDFPLSRG